MGRSKMKTSTKIAKSLSCRMQPVHTFLFYCRYFLVDFYAPTTTVESIMEHLSRDTDVIRPNVVKHPLTQEVKECEGMVPVPLEEKLYSTKKRK